MTDSGNPVPPLGHRIAHELNTPLQFLNDNLYFVEQVLPEMLDREDIDREEVEAVLQALAAARVGVRRMAQSIDRAVQELGVPGFSSAG